uniref:UPAR/Ly6 domain-containing protein n=1 Tax=Paramormyrops kingsleyae TaxID=1676925 RepID=A0A3B3R2A9_9TELE
MIGAKVTHSSCVLTTDSCPPLKDGEVCHKATGRYGSYGVLASRGCVPEKQCSTGSRVFYMGVGYNLSYSCCSLDFCNSSPAAPAPLLLLVLLPAAAALLLPG